MSAEVAEAIRQTRRTLAEKTWVPRSPRIGTDEMCLGVAVALVSLAPEVSWAAECMEEKVADAITDTTGEFYLAGWNDRQADVGAVLGMTLQALIAELCKPTLAPRTTEA